MIAIILAAGESKRFGSNKLTFPINGIPLLQLTISRIKQCYFQKIIVVYRNTEIQKIALHNNCTPVFCPNAADGQSASIKEAVREAGISDGYCFFVGDNPLADEKLIAKMQTVFYRTNTIVAPEFNESLGNPIIFPFRYRTELMRLSGDTGGKKIIYTHMGDVTKIQAPPTVLFDIDTVDDIYKL